MTIFEYRVLLNEELYVNNTEDVLHEIRSMAFGQLSKEVKNVDREKMELVVGVLDEKTLSRTIRVTYRDEEKEVVNGPILDMCKYCGQEGFCTCGDQAKAPTAQEIWDALPEVEGYV
jgi:hypothetical protein